MLEQIVRKFRGIVLLLIVLGLSAVFVLQFGGPQAQGCSQGPSTLAVAEVYGEPISPKELQSAYVLAGGENYPADVAEQYSLEDMVLYGLIERDLLAREARRLGLDVTEDEVLARVAQDGIIHLSMSVDAGPYLPPSGPQRFSFEDRDGQFSKENLKNFIQYRLRRSIREFARSQIQETLAQRMREAIVASITVSAGEVRDAYVREQESAKLDYVRFSNVYYAQQIEPEPAAIAAFMDEHQDAIDAEYEKNKHRYTGLDKQVRSRHILIKVAPDADEAAKQAARERIEGLLARARKGADFAELAEAHSEDESTARKGGDLGYNPEGRMVKPFDEAQFALEPGQISDPVETTFGFHLIKVEDVREGDVPVEEAKREIAESMYREHRAGELAKQAADVLLQKVKAGTPLEEAAQALANTSEDDAADDPLAPALRETRPFGRGGTPVPGPFDSTPLAKAAYQLNEEQPLPEAPMQLGEDWFVYRLAEKTLADEAGFTDEVKARIENALVQSKRAEALKAYVQRLRERAAAEDEIVVREDAREAALGAAQS